MYMFNVLTCISFMTHFLRLSLSSDLMQTTQTDLACHKMTISSTECQVIAWKWDAWTTLYKADIVTM